jgi:glycosyltransferase involved in cell wall biosynthesis
MKIAENAGIAKITLLCSDLDFGGIQRVALLLADGLAAKEGLSVDLAVLRGGGAFMSRHSPDVRVVSLDCTSQPLALLFPNSRLARYLASQKPDTVISFGHSTNCLAAWARLLGGHRFRLIVTEHSAFSARMAQDALFHRWRRTARARFLYKEAEICVCVSEGVANDLVGENVIPGEKAMVIYNPLAGPGLEAEMRELIDHPWLRGDSSRPVIMSAGRLLPLKGIDTLIHAFFRLGHDLKADARLMIAGDGPDRERLEALARELGVSDDVCFLGYVPNPCAYISRASVFALPSRYEGFPSVLVEALACGVNVVSTDCRSGPGEILENGRWGWLVPVGDPAAMAEAISDAMKRPLPPEKLKGRASFFSVDRAVEKYYSLMTGIKRDSHKGGGVS